MNEFDNPGKPPHNIRERKVQMLLALVVLLLVLAVVGGIAIHPLLFLIAVLALLVFVGGRRGSLT